MIRNAYSEMLKAHRAQNTTWGSSAVRNAGDAVVRWIKKHRGIHSILDFGCGTGQLSDYITECCDGVVVTRYDPSVEEYDRLPTDRFDLIVSVDVLEHVEPQDLAKTLNWINGHARRQFHHIDCNETNDRLPDGRDVHLIVERPEWWLSTLQYNNPGWVLMEWHIHHKRKRKRYPRTSTTIIMEQQG